MNREVLFFSANFGAKEFASAVVMIVVVVVVHVVVFVVVVVLVIFFADTVANVVAVIVDVVVFVDVVDLASFSSSFAVEKLNSPIIFFLFPLFLLEGLAVLPQSMPVFIFNTFVNPH